MAVFPSFLVGLAIGACAPVLVIGWFVLLVASIAGFCGCAFRELQQNGFLTAVGTVWLKAFKVVCITTPILLLLPLTDARSWTGMQITASVVGSALGLVIGCFTIVVWAVFRRARRLEAGKKESAEQLTDA